ncbi:MAG: outer membrane lipoprotein-sorting protein [Ignavibacteriaceae bacterium]
MLKSVFYVMNILLLMVVNIYSQDATEIVKKADQLMRANSSYSEITMKIVKPDWSREMSMKVWALEPDYALIYITAPARDKGTVTLKRKTEVWNWLPSAQKVIKIPPSMMLQSWMGSDFTKVKIQLTEWIVTKFT